MEQRKYLVLLPLVLLLTFSSPAQVVLNEVCANNSGVAVTPGGTTPDYIELYNSGLTDLSLAGWALTDDPLKPAKFMFPTDATISASGYLTVWLDDVTNYPGVICTAFSLKASGEEVELFQGGLLRDALIFGLQVPGVPLSRVPDGTGAWQPSSATPGKANAALPAAAIGNPIALRLNEWLATNSAGANMDWVEIYNPKTNGLVTLSGLVISDKTNSVTTPAVGAYSYLESGGFLRFWCDDSSVGGDHLPFKLSSTSGETLSIYQPDRATIIDRVTFGPQSADVSMGRLPDGGTNILYFPGSLMTPGEPNAYRPITNLIVNELLAHTDPPLEDAVEFYNPTALPVNIGNWWLSNNEGQPFKFRIPTNTFVPALGYLVFYEQNQLTAPSIKAGFNRSGTGEDPDFTFNSAHGDSVVLSEALSDGALTGYRLSKNFDASANGVSFGRYVKSDGGTDFVAMARRSFGSDSPLTVTQFRTGTGAANSYPLVGPLVISEIFYEPVPIISNGTTNDNTADEYIELTSITNGSLTLFDPVYPTNTWRLRGGVSFDFPTNVVVGTNASILVVNFDPRTDLVQLSAFRSKYGVSESAPLFGPYSGKLNNSSDNLQLEKPDPVQLPPHPDAGFVPFVLVEKVKYENTNSWPTNASGTGLSIHRINLAGYGNDQTNWFAASPTPGTVGIPPATPITIINPSFGASGFDLSFQTELGRNYTVEFATSLVSQDWTAFTSVLGTGGMMTVEDKSATNGPRYYRVRTP